MYKKNVIKSSKRNQPSRKSIISSGIVDHVQQKLRSCPHKDSMFQGNKHHLTSKEGSLFNLMMYLF